MRLVNGFLLIDSGISLIIATILVTYVLIWQQQIVSMQQYCTKRIHAHAVGCSVRDALSQGRSYNSFSVKDRLYIEVVRCPFRGGIGYEGLLVRVVEKGSKNKLIELAGYRPC